MGADAGSTYGRLLPRRSARRRRYGDSGNARCKLKVYSDKDRPSEKSGGLLVLPNAATSAVSNFATPATCAFVGIFAIISAHSSSVFVAFNKITRIRRSARPFAAVQPVQPLSACRASPAERVNNRSGRPRRPDRAYLVHKRTKGGGTILAPTLIVQTSDIARPRENSRRPPETRFTSVPRLIVR